MKRVLMVTTAFGLSAATAMAANLPYRNQMAVKAPACAPAFSRTGFYIGVNGGGAFGTLDLPFALTGEPPLRSIRWPCGRHDRVQL